MKNTIKPINDRLQNSQLSVLKIFSKFLINLAQIFNENLTILYPTIVWVDISSHKRTKTLAN